MEKTNFSATIGARSLWEDYLPAFEQCIKVAKASHVMCSYNSINGVPACAHDALLNRILRHQWGFDGFVVGDYDAWADVYTAHKYTPSMLDAAAVGLNSGIDQEGGGTAAVALLHDAISRGKTSAAKVAQALRRLLRVRIRLGMLDPPSDVAYNHINASVLQSAAHLSLARRTARASMTLLKNDDSALPLSPAALRRPAGATPALALIGPQAMMAGLLHGNYAESAAEGNWGQTVREAVAARVPAVSWATGCDDIDCKSTGGFAEAARVASTADAVVVLLGLGANAIGGTPRFVNTGGPSNEAESHDRDAIELPGRQADLVHALRIALGPSKKLIGLLVHGGTLALGSAASELDAILSAWYPGLEGAAAIAETIFGEYNPAGRTASTWYVSTSVLPDGWTTGEMDESADGGITYRYDAHEIPPLSPPPITKARSCVCSLGGRSQVSQAMEVRRALSVWARPLVHNVHLRQHSSEPCVSAAFPRRQQQRRCVRHAPRERRREQQRRPRRRRGRAALPPAAGCHRADHARAPRRLRSRLPPRRKHAHRHAACVAPRSRGRP